MSYSIKDIDEWKKAVPSYSFLEKFYYPLLNFIWKTYDDFDKDIENDQNKKNYISVCSFFINPWTEGKENDKELCMKLVRNLGHHSDNKVFLSYKGNDCFNLNNWIYNSMKKHSVPEKILTGCFEEYKGIVEGMGKEPTCFYYDYDNTYKEPMNIIILKIFESNIHIIKNILEGEIDSVHCSCRKFIEDLISIYKYMKKKYCSSHIVMGKSNTCEQLDIFEGLYQILYNNPAVKDKIPSLKNEKHVNLFGCESHISLRGKQSTETYQNEEAVETPPAPQFDDNNDSNNPISPTVSTALGTVAGASSFLALLYKFSPGRNWIRSGFRGGTGRISSNLYADQPNEVFYNGYEGEIMSSYNPTYNVGYGSA